MKLNEIKEAGLNKWQQIKAAVLGPIGEAIQPSLFSFLSLQPNVLARKAEFRNQQTNFSFRVSRMLML